MNVAFERPAAATADSIPLSVRIVAVLVAGLLTGAALGLAAVAAFDRLRASEPLLYTAG